MLAWDMADPTLKLVVRYIDLDRLARDGATSDGERAGAQKRMAKMEQEHPGIGACADVIQRSFDAWSEDGDEDRSPFYERALATFVEGLAFARHVQARLPGDMSLPPLVGRRVHVNVRRAGGEVQLMCRFLAENNRSPKARRRVVRIIGDHLQEWYSA